MRRLRGPPENQPRQDARSGHFAETGQHPTAEQPGIFWGFPSRAANDRQEKGLNYFKD
jgi:hypothetical protein